MNDQALSGICPFFIVSDVTRAMEFWCDKLGFATWHQQPESRPFFAIVGREGAMLMVKSGEATPSPNSMRDPEMRWDAYITVQSPDALAAEFSGRGASFRVPLRDTDDGLRGFEITDPDGYVLFFGRPR